jgi:hypothetical protein
MILGDFGTSYCKFLNLNGQPAPPTITPTKDLPAGMRVDLATGHNGKRFAERYVNELIALARGGERLIKERSYVVLDCGSRDIKYVAIKNGRLDDMGWNAECGASMGFTIELLENYYHLDYNTMDVPSTTFNITCGVLGMSHIFDAVINGVAVDEAVACFVKGIAINAFRFAGSPDKIYLSGGLCENELFIRCLPCQVVPLGRFVLLEGLKAMAKQSGERTDLETP